MAGKYYLNGVDFETLGVVVIKSDGELSILKPKPRFSIDWPDEDGVDIDEDEVVRFEQREIVLECYMKSTTSALVESALKTFQDTLTTAGFKRFKSYKEDKRAHLVYLNDFYNFRRYNAGKLITFTVKLVEPQTVAKQYKVSKITENTGSVTVTLTTAAPLDIYWGDGQKTLAALSNVSHNYTFGSNTEFTLSILGKASLASVLSVAGTSLTVTTEI